MTARKGSGQVVMGPNQPRPKPQDRVPSAPPRGVRSAVTAAVPDSSFRGQLAEALCAREGATVDDLTPESRVTLFADLDALMPTIAAEVKARVQAAANQQAVEEDLLTEALGALDTVAVWSGTMAAAQGGIGVRDYAEQTAASIRAALASPAPAPRAEEGP